MNKEQISKIMMILQTNYPYYFEKLNDEELETLLKLYEAVFNDYDYNVVSKAIMNIINTDDYFPPISRIKREIANMETSNLGVADDEWNKVIDIVHEVGQRDLEEAYSKMSEYTRYIVKHVGYVNICMADSEQQKWNKKEFIEEYNALKDKQKELIQIGNKEMKLFELKEME